MRATLYKLLILLCLNILGISTAVSAAGVPIIDVAKDDIYIGDLLRDASPEVAHLVFGPAPKPGQSRLVTRREVTKRLQRARVGISTVDIPLQVRVKRLSQTISESRFARLVRKSLQRELSTETKIKDIRVPGGLLLGKGRVSVKMNRRAKYKEGWQTVLAQVYVDGSRVSSFPVNVSLEWPERAGENQVVVERGAQVMIVVRKGGVAIKTRALAQEPGVLGAFIAVLPHTGRKLIRAKVLDANTVEMRL